MNTTSRVVTRIKDERRPSGEYVWLSKTEIDVLRRVLLKERDKGAKKLTTQGDRWKFEGESGPIFQRILRKLPIIR